MWQASDGETKGAASQTTPNTQFFRCESSNVITSFMHVHLICGRVAAPALHKYYFKADNSLKNFYM